MRPDKTTGSMCGRLTGERLLLKRKNKKNTIVESTEEILLELANKVHFVGPGNVYTAPL